MTAADRDAVVPDWWASSRKSKVAHLLLGPDLHPACGRVVIHRDGYPTRDLPACKRCAALLSALEAS